jgi:hypothetical protein
VRYFCVETNTCVKRKPVWKGSLSRLLRIELYYVISAWLLVDCTWSSTCIVTSCVDRKFQITDKLLDLEPGSLTKQYRTFDK